MLVNADKYWSLYFLSYWFPTLKSHISIGDTCHVNSKASNAKLRYSIVKKLGFNCSQNSHKNPNVSATACMLSALLTKITTTTRSAQVNGKHSSVLL